MSRYLTAAAVRSLGDNLSPWEQDVLRTLRTVRVATAAQLARLHCQAVSTRHCRRRLASLADRRLITRLERVIGGRRAGSSGWIYALDVAGLRLTDAPGTHRRPWTPGLRFLAHSLAVTEIYVQLREAEATGTVELLHFATEPDCWHSSTGAGGRQAILKPDAYVKLGLGEYEDHYLLEVDRSTVSVVTLARQCAAYWQAWQSGSLQAELGVYPQVLWVVPDERRKAVLVDVLAAQPAEAWPLFQVTTEDRAIAVLTGGQP